MSPNSIFPNKLGAAVGAELRSLGIIQLTLGALDGHLSSLLSGVAKGYQGTEGLVNHKKMNAPVGNYQTKVFW
jgi:hypothetical protein